MYKTRPVGGKGPGYHGLAALFVARLGKKPNFPPDSPVLPAPPPSLVKAVTRHTSSAFVSRVLVFESEPKTEENHESMRSATSLKFDNLALQRVDERLR